MKYFKLHPLWRKRIDNFRILFALDTVKKILRVLEVSRRDSDTYQNLDRLQKIAKKAEGNS